MAEAAGVKCQRETSLGLLNLRGDAEDPPFRNAVAEALGMPLPVDPCTRARSESGAAYWVGPDEWVLSVSPGSEGELEARLRAAVSDPIMTDVSGAYVRFLLSGPNALSVMMKSGPCDYRFFHLNDRCVGTVFAQTTALVAAGADETSFEILVRRSYARYVGLWIADAVAEYGLAP